MPSKIQVDQIAGATGSTVTLPSGQTLDLSSGTVTLPSTALSALNASNLTSGTVPSARLSLTSSDLPTVPTTKGGTGLTTIGTAAQVLRVNSGATGLEFGTLASGIIQIKQTVKTDTFTSSSSSFTDITGMSVSITPTLSTSKILVVVEMKVGGVSTGTPTNYKLLRDSTDIYIGDASGSRSRVFGSHSIYDPASVGYAMYHVVGFYIDNPATTSTTTYKVQMNTDTSASHVNRTHNDSNNANYPRTASTITAIELAVGIL